MDNSAFDLPVSVNPINSIVGFFDYARTNGLNVGFKETESTVSAAELGLIANRTKFKYGLKSICCGCVEDLPKFDKLFEDYWSNLGELKKQKITIKSEYQKEDNTPGTLIMMGNKNSGGDGDKLEGKSMTGANVAERLRKTDFSKLSEIDNEFFEELAQNLWKQMSYRLKRKLNNDNKGIAINFSKTIRNSISKGGWPQQLIFKKRKQVKKRLVMLLDVSGSMDKYSFYLLKFIYVLRQYFERIEAFTFSTSLTRITRMLERKNLDEVLFKISNQVQSWSSGTKIGECLQEFNSKYAKEILSRSSIVVILSDGLDTGNISILSEAVRKIKMKTSRLIWLNPLKGMKGYAPIQKGMVSALPFIDEFHSAHNLESLLQLEKYLKDV
ncbi:MAG: VWA domain-containing protein [Bacteroidetes bacterium]|nr:VWA domain-containing protein [Bacteroidota bacterium]